MTNIDKVAKAISDLIHDNPEVEITIVATFKPDHIIIGYSGCMPCAIANALEFCLAKGVTHIEQKLYDSPSTEKIN